MPNDARAPVEEYMKTPDFKNFQKQMGQMQKIKNVMQAGFLQKMAELHPFKKALGMVDERIKGLLQQMPKPVSELHQQPEANAGQGQPQPQGQGVDPANARITY